MANNQEGHGELEENRLVPSENSAAESNGTAVDDNVDVSY